MFVLTSIALTFVSAAALLLQSKRVLLQQLHDGQSTLNISRQPYELSTSDVLTIIILLIFKSLKNALGYSPGTIVQPLPEAHSGPKNGSGGRFILPNLSITMPLSLRREDVELYVTAVSSRDTNASSSVSANDLTSFVADNSVHLALFLAAVTEPALLLLLARKQCPINPLGAVNVRNHFRIVEPSRCRQLVEELSSDYRPANDNAQSTLRASVSITAELHDARKVNRGVEFDIRVSVKMFQNDAVSMPIFYQLFTVLEANRSRPVSKKTPQPFPKNGGAQPALATEQLPSATTVSGLERRRPLQTTSAVLRVRHGDPLSWAKLCKDYNPIHTSSLAARLFGFKTKIAHGNHVVAKAVYVLGPTRDADFMRFDDRHATQQVWMDISFKRPVLLPADLDVRLIEQNSEHCSSDDKRQFGAIDICKAGKAHVECSFGSIG